MLAKSQVSMVLGVLSLTALMGCGPRMAPIATWPGKARAIRFTPDGRYVVVRIDHGISILDASGGAVLWSSNVPPGSKLIAEPTGMDLSHDGRCAVYVEKGRLTLVAVPTGRELRIATLWPEMAVVAFSPDGKLLAIDYSALEVRTAAELEPVVRLEPRPRFQANAIAFSPDGRTLATAGFGRAIELWDAQTWTRRDALRVPTYVSSLVFSPDGRYIAAGVGGKAIILWDATSRREIWRREFKDGPAGYALAFSPDGRWLVTGGDRGRAAVLDVLRGEVALEWVAHPRRGRVGAGVFAMAFSPDGRRLATSGLRPGIRLWAFDRFAGRLSLRSR